MANPDSLKRLSVRSSSSGHEPDPGKDTDFSDIEGSKISSSIEHVSSEQNILEESQENGFSYPIAMFPPNGMDSNKIEGKENEIIKATPSQEATRPQKLAVKAFIQLDGNETDPDIEEKPDDSNGNGPDIEEKPDDSNGTGPETGQETKEHIFWYKVHT